MLGGKLRQVLAEQQGRAGPSCAQPQGRGAGVGLQPGLGWMLEVPDQLRWKGLCCCGAQRLKARGHHIDAAVLAHSPDEVARPGTWVIARAAEAPEQAVLKDTAPTSLFTQCWFCVLSNLYVRNTVPEALVKWTVLYIAMEKASLSCTDWACNQRKAEVYASFKFKSQSNRFDSQGWHLVICPTSQVKFRAIFRTSVWTECHDTSVYLLHNMPYEHVMFNWVKNNCTLT